MGYLAFDRNAVRLLGLSLQRALTELERVRITDDRAALERGQVAAAERAVAGWSERLRDISMCSATRPIELERVFKLALRPVPPRRTDLIISQHQSLKKQRLRKEPLLW